MELRLGLLCLRSSTLQADAEKVVDLARALEPLRGTEGEPLDEALVRTVALSSAGVLSPMAAILGAVAAQEVLKVGAGTGGVGLGGMQRSLWVPEGAQLPKVTLEASPTWVQPPARIQGVRRWQESLRCWSLGNLQEVHAPGPVAVF